MENRKMFKMITLLCLVFISSNVFAQTDTRYNTDMNLPFNQKAGDVNPQTGDINISATDMSLPGRAGMDFSYGRIWNITQSNAFNITYKNGNALDNNTVEKQALMGVGWRSTVPFIQKIENDNFSSTNLFFGGGAYQIDVDNLTNKSGEVSNLLGYDLLNLIIYSDQSISYNDAGAVVDILTVNYTDVVINKNRRNAYLLTLKDNSKYFFDNTGKLMMQQDKTGLNKIWYFYDATDRLKLVLDSIGREIEFDYDLNGNLSEISWDVSYGSINGETRTWIENERRSITYSYAKAQDLYPGYDWVGYKNSVGVDYKDPYLLVSVQNPYDKTIEVGVKDNVTETKYDYMGAVSKYSFDKSALVAKDNLHFLITGISSGYSNVNTVEKFINKRNLVYSLPENGKQQKDFYNGFIQTFKIKEQFYNDRHNNRKIKPTEYVYIEAGEQGFSKSYQTVIKSGNVITKYIYSLNGSNRALDNVLSSVVTETLDGFSQEKVFEYNQFRTKTKEITKRDGMEVFSESFNYDSRSNLTWHLDRVGLETLTSYYDKYDVPREVVKKVTVDGTLRNYKTENVIDSYGRIINQIIYLDDGTNNYLQSSTKYDQYGNVIENTNFNGVVSKIDYDTVYNSFPVRNYTENVEIPNWTNGIANNWMNNPDVNNSIITVQNLRKYNSDGSVWIEVDNDGFAIEHYYNKLGEEVRTVNPDQGDVQVTNLENQAQLNSFLTSRAGNPGAEMKIHYQDGLVKTYSDIDKASASVKVSGVQTDGLGNTESEIEYGLNGIEYKNVKTYDDLGRMVALTDADASPTSVATNIHGTSVNQHDKTWLVLYDDLNRQKQVIYPVTEKGTAPGIKTIQYDDLNNSVTTKDPENRKTVQTMDWNGNVLELLAMGDYSTPSTEQQIYTYRYDEMGRKTLFTDPMGIQTAYIYNERDLLIEQRFTNKSDFMFYDAMGNVEKKIDRKGQVTLFEYDVLGRNISVKSYLSEADLASNTLYNKVDIAFDKRGNAVRIDNENLIEYYEYDYGNRVTTLKRKLKDSLIDIKNSVQSVWSGTVPDQEFNFSYTYNDAGMVTSMIYPDGAEHTFAYDNVLGRLAAISEKSLSDLTANSVVSSLTYTNSGVVTDMTYVNGVTQHWDFDNRKRISKINISTATGVLEELNYTLNKNGDILTINENEYKYDGFNRIIGAKTLLPTSGNDPSKLVKESFGTYQNNAPLVVDDKSIEYNPLADLNQAGSDGKINGLDHIAASFVEQGSIYDIESFTYDKNGNRTSLTQNGDIYTYIYGERNRLTSVLLKKKGTNSAVTFITYQYDDNGNLTKRDIHRDSGLETVLFKYDTMNRLIETTEPSNTTKYFYDNAGNRFIKSSSDGSATLYLRHGQIAVAMDIEIPKTGSDYKGKINRYILSGDLVAGRVTKTTNTDSSTTITKSYYHLDHLNSTKLVTDETAAIEANYTYRAFGEQLNDLQTKDAKYTYVGKELDTNTNLYYFNARFYDPTIGRFINVDPIQDGTNWYIYCSNNPLNMVDPTGLAETRNVSVDMMKTNLKYTPSLVNIKKGTMQCLIAFEKSMSLADIASSFKTAGILAGSMAIANDHFSPTMTGVGKKGLETDLATGSDAYLVWTKVHYEVKKENKFNFMGKTFKLPSTWEKRSTDWLLHTRGKDMTTEKEYRKRSTLFDTNSLTNDTNFNKQYREIASKSIDYAINNDKDMELSDK